MTEMKMLKKFLLCSFLCVFATTLSSCDLNDDDGTTYYFEAVETISALFPAEFERGRVYRIEVVVNRPSSCHFIEGFDFNRTGETATERTIYPIASVLNRTDCEDFTDRTFNTSFNFEVLFSETYVFKLYAGEDENGDEQFLIYEVPVAGSGRE